MDFGITTYAGKILMVAVLSGEMPYSALNILGTNTRGALKAVTSLRDKGYVMISKSVGVKRIKIKMFQKKMEEDEDFQKLFSGIQEFRILPPTSKAIEIFRRHRVAETIIMVLEAGVIVTPGRKPALAQLKVIPENSYFYLSTEWKKIVGEAKNKGSRFTGALVSPAGIYTTYNMSANLMEWAMIIEARTSQLFHFVETRYCPWSLNSDVITDAAIFFSEKYELLIDILNNKNIDGNGRPVPRPRLTLDQTFTYMYYLPLTRDGQKILRMMLVRNWRRWLDTVFFTEEETIIQKHSHIDCDAVVDNTYILLFCKNELTKFKNFIGTLLTDKSNNQFKIVCYDFQKDVVMKLAKGRADIVTFPIDVVVAAFYENVNIG